MVAKSGDPLLPDEAVAALRAEMLPLAHVLTPNLPEAARLLGAPVAADAAEMAEQGRALLALGPEAVVMKGGHGTGAECVDLLVTGEGTLRLSARRQVTRNTHGTGCSLSAAIAAGLARGLALPEAVRAAHGWLQGAIAAADVLGVGQGHGPIHHFHGLWADG
jgi:hydroxymethylpyrimidine/phosphomethylpyrimidine kinase